MEPFPREPNKISNEIPKALYEKAACWMADYEEPCFLEETMPKEDVEEYLLDVAMDIMNQIYRIYADSDGGRN